MSDLDAELVRLGTAAVDIALIPDPKKRHDGGFWLQGQLDSCFSSHIFTAEQRIDFMVIVKIMLDVIFRDAIEGPEDMKEFEAEESSVMQAHLEAAQKGAMDLL